MQIRRPLYPLTPGLLFCLLLLAACAGKKVKNDQSVIVDKPEEMMEKVAELIRVSADQAISSAGDIGDSVFLHQPQLARDIYSNNSYKPLWSDQRAWLPLGDSIFQFIQSSRLFGLFPSDYHEKAISAIREKFGMDKTTQFYRKDASLWSKADIMLTDALLQMIKDIKLGRLPNDSITLRKDSVLTDEFYLHLLDSVKISGSLTAILQSLEPRQRGYQLLKAGIKRFLDSADNREFTKVPVPAKPMPAGFREALQKRLYEGRYLAFDSVRADSAQLAEAVKRFQKEKGITVDGVPGEATVRMLNVSDKDRFVRIAISMDKYKMLPEQMPSKYIWVNTSGNYLEVVANDTVELYSRVICGKPKTRTPLLNSSISTLITYPQWVPPPSIVSKEILPAVKRDPGYLAKKGFSLVDSKGEEVDPYTVDWSKYNKHIPYKVVQGSGDANALGIMKFHFDNKYSVYLHDTNQRYLFANAMRSLSHGCVRVQEWQKLTWYIIANDSLINGGRSNVKKDSIKTWLERKEKHNISIRNKFPVFIRYFTCEGRDGKVIFYDDPYGEDRFLREKYFASK